MDEQGVYQLDTGTAGPSIVDRFPVELTSVVFAFYTTELTPQTSPFTLGAVCQRWRDIAWSAPDVWSRLTAYFNSRRDLTETRLQLVEEWLKRSGKVPLSITLSAHWEKPEQRLPRLHRLLDVVKQHADQWYNINFKLPASTLVSLCYPAKPSPNLNMLSFSGWSQRSSEVMDYANAVPASLLLRPRILSMQRLRSDPLYLGWERVTTCTVQSISIRSIIYILHHAPNLRKCHFASVIRSPSAPSIDGTSHVTHNRLESLHITYRPHSDGLPVGGNDRLFANITLPKLEHLHVLWSQTRIIVNPLVCFIARSSCHLETLSISALQYPGNELVDLVKLVPLLKELRVFYASFLRGRRHPFFEALVNHLPQNGTNEASSAPALLPHLRVFECYGQGQMDWDLLPNFVTPLSCDEGSPRRPLRTINAHLRLPPDTTVVGIPQHVVAELKESSVQVSFTFSTQTSVCFRTIYQSCVLTLDRPSPPKI